MITNFLMVIDPHAPLVMFTFYHAQWSGYLQCNIFPSLGILQCYIEFDAHIVAMLEKLWVVLKVKILWHHNGTFGSLSSHYSYLFKGARPSLSALMRYPHCLGCWVLNIPRIVFHFQQDDHSTLLDVGAHVRLVFIPPRQHYEIPM